jgi:hypothetical protein
MFGEMMRKTPEEIIKVLHSITKVKIDQGELDTWFDDDTIPSGIRGFIPNSFTRELLELIEVHLLEEDESR